MFKESDHIHIIAMSTALGTGVRVKYMDRGAEKEVIAHDFPENATPSVHLLYRPGHYDILYPWWFLVNLLFYYQSDNCVSPVFNCTKIPHACFDF